MGAIKVENYQNIVNFYTDAEKQLADIADYYYNAAYEIVRLQVFDPELDLLLPFWNAYLASTVIYKQAPAAIVSAVRSLQDHVLKLARTDPDIDDAGEQRFTTLDDWLDAGDTQGVLSTGSNGGADPVGRKDDVDSSFKVTSEFASLSSQSGHAISSGNIS